MNAMPPVEELGLAVRSEMLLMKKLLSREVIRGDENQKSSRIRERVKEVQQNALNALSEGGSSYATPSHVTKIVKS